MVGVMWPKWVAWLLAIAILLNLLISLVVWARVNSLSGLLGGKSAYRNRAELEEAFRSGAVSREEYERLKARLS
ncbi:putative membrane protein [Symbiobacterium terraclitae]|uniref:Membrane protein n=1 Tax=Symbiobacterium terraclitae TaxID=557451 RepID=A0ABS4JSH1_9FIRM|nr:SHOCT domain-containing protein [Symbiobacterium terraclitae]MBP2017851.1 putative membrane protein [Symbiobacterium terraclitae]